MSIGKFKPEREFLIDLAVQRFNKQFLRKIDPTTCKIKSIAPSYRCTHGYEIETIKTNDFLKLRLYFSVQNKDLFCPYRVEVEGETFKVGALGDEVYVTVGTLSDDWVEGGIYKFRWIDEDGSLDNYLLDTDGNILEWVEGGGIRTMG